MKILIWAEASVLLPSKYLPKQEVFVLAKLIIWGTGGFYVII